jgi:hypothetical protein
MSKILNAQTFSGNLTLDGANEFNALNTFDGAVVLNAGLEITTGAVNGYVLTSDASGNAAWAAAANSLLTSSASTVNATPAALVTIALGSDGAVSAFANIGGTAADYSTVCGGFIQVTVKSIGGVHTIVGAPLVSLNTPGSASFAAAISGNDLVINVVGDTAANNWNATYFYNTSV